MDRIINKIRRMAYNALLYRFGFGNRVSRKIWEKQFGGTEWDYLYSDAEKDHYLSIVKLFKKHGERKVLDVGCGQGVLYSYLLNGIETKPDYLGIDISANAIKKAKDTFPGAAFEQLDFEYQKLTGKFDVIIFNETLYYFNRPLATIQKCIEQQMSKGGYFIISMCDYVGHEVIWKKLGQRFDFLSVEEITNAEQQKWKVVVFRP